MNLKKNLKYGYWLLAISYWLLAGCGNNQSTPTQGKLKIEIDESYSQLFAAELESFHALYKGSTIEAIYKPEGEIINDLLADSCRVVILNRELNQKEKEYFESKKSFPTSTKIAIDALAFIAHKDNPVKEITFSELKDIFLGKKTQWKEFSPEIKNKSPQDTSITIVFDNEKSCNVRMVKEKLLGGKNFPKNIFALKTNPEVVNYVSTHKGALGIIGVNWISDADDTLTRSFLSKVNVLEVASEENPADFFQPYQATIYQGEYPFTRNVYIINREGRTGLGTGFAAFVAGEKGQLIILKAGMVPATQPIRMVHLTNK